MFYYLFVIFISNLLMNMKCFEANILLNRKPNVKLVLYIFNVNVLLEVNKHTIFLFIFFLGGVKCCFLAYIPRIIDRSMDRIIISPRNSHIFSHMQCVNTLNTQTTAQALQRSTRNNSGTSRF